MVSGISESMSAMSGIDMSAMMKNRQAEMFAEIDTNSDGYLDETELETWKANRPEPPEGAPEPPAGAPEPPEDPFSSMDTDGDGLISEAEFEEANAQMEAERQSMMAQQQASSASQLSSESIQALLEALQKSSDESGTANSILEEYSSGILASIQPSVDVVA